MKKIDIMGVSFDDCGMDAAVERALELIDNRKAAYAVTPNPEIVMAAQTDHRLLTALGGASLVLPDGVGVVRAGAIMGRPFAWGKLPGIDFALTLMQRLGERGGSVFLFGAKPGVAEQAAGELGRLCPGLRVAGTADGYFRDDAPVVEALRETKPDLLLVCLGYPKQEYWMADHAGALPVGLMAGLGGSLDVWAGAVKRAPESWQKLGLEWLYRLIREPSRLGRMMVLPRFLRIAKQEAVRMNGKG